MKPKCLRNIYDEPKNYDNHTQKGTDHWCCLQKQMDHLRAGQGIALNTVVKSLN